MHRGGRYIGRDRHHTGKRTRLRSKYGTPEFFPEYQAALAGKPISDKGALVDGSLAWLVTRYRETTVWQGLSSATKKQRENFFAKSSHLRVISRLLRLPRQPLRLAVIGVLVRHSRRDISWILFVAYSGGRWTPAWSKLIQPRASRKSSRAKGDGFMPWTEDDVAAYEKLWPVGTRQRVWLDRACARRFTNIRIRARSDASQCIQSNETLAIACLELASDREVGRSVFIPEQHRSANQCL